MKSHISHMKIDVNETKPLVLKSHQQYYVTVYHDQVQDFSDNGSTTAGDFMNSLLNLLEPSSGKAK